MGRRPGHAGARPRRDAPPRTRVSRRREPSSSATMPSTWGAMFWKQPGRKRISSRKATSASSGPPLAPQQRLRGVFAPGGRQSVCTFGPRPLRTVSRRTKPDSPGASTRISIRAPERNGLRTRLVTFALVLRRKMRSRNPQPLPRHRDPDRPVARRARHLQLREARDAPLKAEAERGVDLHPRRRRRVEAGDRVAPELRDPEPSVRAGDQPHRLVGAGQPQLLHPAGGRDASDGPTVELGEPHVPVGPGSDPERVRARRDPGDELARRCLPD